MANTAFTRAVRDYFRTVAFYWRMVVAPHRREAFLILLLVAGASLLDMVTIGLSVPLFDAITHADRAADSHVLQTVAGWLQQWGLSPDTNGLVFVLLTVACVLFVVRGICLYLQQYVSNVVALRLRNDMKTKLFERFLRGRYEETSKQARGTIVHHMNEPSSAIYYAMLSLATLMTGLLSGVLMAGLMVSLSWRATTLIGILAAFGAVAWQLFWGHRSVTYGRAVYEARGEQAKVEVDALDGLKVVKAHGLEPLMVQRERALLEAESRPRLHLVFGKYFPTLANEMIACLIVIVLGATALFFPAWGIRFSMLIAFLLAARRITASLASLHVAGVQLSESKRALEVIEEVLVLPQERRGGRTVEPIQEIRVDRVSFAYASRPRHQVLDRVSCSMRRGTVTAIVGPTGSGKSTIASLLIHLYEPQAGAILVNEINLRDIDLAGWRQRIGYVCQDIFVFNSSIRDNIAVWDPEALQEGIEWAARVAQLHEFITGLPDRYDTVVGDRGLRLSGGQCQRLAIARALLRKPEVLIFDEATSALDNLTERAVYAAISAMRTQAIIVVISHRLSTVRDADQILVLHAGQVVETGTHESLLRHGGVYAALYEETIAAKEPAEVTAVPGLDPKRP